MTARYRGETIGYFDTEDQAEAAIEAARVAYEIEEKLFATPGGWLALISKAPDAVLIPEAARRNGGKRKSYTGGKFWAQHNPNTARCRCVGCSKKRAKKRAL